MDCKSAHMVLALGRPGAGELDAVESAALRAHLAGCPACAALAERDQDAEEQLGRAVRDVPLPEGLRGRLLRRLAADRALHRRRLLRRVAGVAAALLLAIAGAWYVRLSLRPVLDVDAIVRRDDERPSSPEKVEEWFRDNYGVVMVAPAQFNDAPLNYALLESCNLVKFQGVEVPQLVFFRQGPGAALARIYVLSDGAFNLDDAAVPLPAAGSRHRVEVFRHPENPHIAYVILYTGESLTPFLITSRPGA